MYSNVNKVFVENFVGNINVLRSTFVHCIHCREGKIKERINKGRK